MSISNLAVTGWRAFWANVLSPATLSISIAFLVVAFLLGFAFSRMMGAMNYALRAIALWAALVLVIGFLSALGIDLSSSGPVVNWFLNLIQAPFYVPVA